MEVRLVSKIRIVLDPSVINVSPFNELAEFEVKKIELFKYGALNIVPPSHVKESDFEYQQGKVPNLHGLWNDFIHMDPKRIVSFAVGETATDLHELVGVGVAVAYSISLLKFNPNIISKIPSAKGGGQILDFTFVCNGKKYELECRGTIYPKRVKEMLSGILSKKIGKPDIAVRYGGVTLIRAPDDNRDSTLTVGDDNREILTADSLNIGHYIEYYKSVLSFILDSKYYNAIDRALSRTKLPKRIFRSEKVTGIYHFNKRLYKGAFFDRRLILRKIQRLTGGNPTLHSLLKNLTDTEGKQKLFLGIESSLLEDLSFGRVQKIASFEGVAVSSETDGSQVFCDKDGILIVHDKDNSNSQIQEGLPEKEVQRRLSLIYRYIRKEPHRCGAPCRSREIAGKSCEIVTYAAYCHFHR